MQMVRCSTSRGQVTMMVGTSNGVDCWMKVSGMAMGMKLSALFLPYVWMRKGRICLPVAIWRFERSYTVGPKVRLVTKSN